MKKENLNDLYKSKQWSRFENVDVEVYFRNIEQVLISYIEKFDYVFGSVAWLTSKPVLKALAKKKGVCLIVQKEDFLRPDVNVRYNWKRDLRKLYDALPQPFERHMIYSDISSCSDPGLDAVRCVGNYNEERNKARPLCHHKFLIFMKDDPKCYEGLDAEYAAPYLEPFWMRAVPTCVWTGSYNITENATNSLENVVVLWNDNIVFPYLSEFKQLLLLSEPLDWEHKWVAPEWRIGS